MQFKIGNIQPISNSTAPRSVGSINGTGSDFSIPTGLDYESLFEDAVLEYKAQVSRELSRMPDDALQEKIKEFEKKHRPSEGTAEEIRAFEAALDKYKESLERLAHAETKPPRLSQVMTNQKSLLDLRGQDSEEGRSWTQPSQGQALQSVVGRYTDNLSATILAAKNQEH